VEWREGTKGGRASPKGGPGLNEKGGKIRMGRGLGGAGIVGGGEKPTY